MPVKKKKSNSERSSVWWDFFVTNRFLLPIVSAIVSILGLAIIFVLPLIYGSKEDAIDDKLISGVVPDAVFVQKVDRPDLVELVRNSFLIQQPQTYLGFGVILGPTGSGKTYLTRFACNHFKNGVLYHEIADPSFFPERLARTIGMKLADDINLFDILREKAGVSSLITFYRLPQNLSMALSFVLDTLAKRGAEYQKKFNRMPCLFIDGVDLLAKKYPEVFLTLLDLAKHYANNAMLRIILVGRENQILPLLDSTSLRVQAHTIEIVDIDKEATLNYLKQNSLSESAAEKVANLTGGRFSLLNKAIEIYVHKIKTLDEESVFGHIKSHLLTYCYVKKVRSVNEKILLNYIWQYSSFWPEIIDTINNPKVTTEELMRSLNSLINHDVLRYTVDGDIDWHSEVTHYGFTDYMDVIKKYEKSNQEL